LRYFEIACISILIIFNVTSCGYQLEDNLIGRSSEPGPPIISLVVPSDGSRIDSSMNQIDITFSEEVTGADSSSNYVLSGQGVGSLTIVSVSSLGSNSYRISVTGTPGDGTITLTINNIVDSDGTGLQDNTIGYIGCWNADWLYRRRLIFDN